MNNKMSHNMKHTLFSEKITAFKEGMPNRGGDDEKKEDKRVVMKFGGSSLADASRVSYDIAFCVQF